jgi:hypothetical protein
MPGISSISVHPGEVDRVSGVQDVGPAISRSTCCALNGQGCYSGATLCDYSLSTEQEDTNEDKHYSCELPGQPALTQEADPNSQREPAFDAENQDVTE